MPRGTGVTGLCEAARGHWGHRYALSVSDSGHYTEPAARGMCTTAGVGIFHCLRGAIFVLKNNAGGLTKAMILKLKGSLMLWNKIVLKIENIMWGAFVLLMSDMSRLLLQELASFPS